MLRDEHVLIRRDSIGTACKQTQMDHNEAGHYWNDSAESWAKLARAGYDVYRNHLNTPAFFAMLPDVEGLSGLDIGCGEGFNRLRDIVLGLTPQALCLRPLRRLYNIHRCSVHALIKREMIR